MNGSTWNLPTRADRNSNPILRRYEVIFFIILENRSSKKIRKGVEVGGCHIEHLLSVCYFF